MTEEQRDMIKNKDDANFKIDTNKLAEAEAIAAQIEADSYSKLDMEFERKNNRRGADDNLTDDQLVELFSEMKRETTAKRAEKMERFKVETKDDALLEDLNDELEGMMLEDEPANPNQ